MVVASVESLKTSPDLVDIRRECSEERNSTMEECWVEGDITTGERKCSETGSEFA